MRVGKRNHQEVPSAEVSIRPPFSHHVRTNAGKRPLAEENRLPHAPSGP